MLSAVRNRALRLKRVAVGGLPLGALPCGKWRELTEKEVDSIFNQSNKRSASNAAPQAASSRVSGN